MRPYKLCALMMDLRGRSIRTSNFIKPTFFKTGDVFEMRTDGMDIESTRDEVQINYFDLPPVMREHDLVILGDDGQVQGTVVEIARTSFKVEVKQEGVIDSYSVVKIPGTRIQQLPVLQLEDKIDIKDIATKNFFDFLVVP